MENGHGGDIYSYDKINDFSANISPFGTPEEIIRAIGDAAGFVAPYPDFKCRRLREAIAEKESAAIASAIAEKESAAIARKTRPGQVICRSGTEDHIMCGNVSADHIICGNGAADLIYRFVMALKPRQALLPAPCFIEYAAALETVGCSVKYYMLNKEDFILDDGFIDAIKEDTDMVILCSPNNPTGKLIPGQLLKSIIDKCRLYGTYILVDECFMDFASEQKRYSSFSFSMSDEKSFSEYGNSGYEDSINDGPANENTINKGPVNENPINKDSINEGSINEDSIYEGPLCKKSSYIYKEEIPYDRLLTLRAFTKMYGMAGVRLGYALCRNEEIIEKMMQSGPPWNVSTLAQAAGICALKLKDYPEKVRSCIREQKKYLYRELDALGIEYYESDANFILIRLSPGINLKEKLLEKGFLIRDCSNYAGLGKGYYRMAVKQEKDNVQLIEALKEVLKDYKEGL